ncbi:uncharacterized protein EDB93DRAFT_1294699 [Suillus bovinus]|uniref:uncharacterized protein n=1 Tax=Suillus bovinus TaxID=48563 RepID=UPI001B8601CE|nr:uncharacterized protein EDB93DRAFT_1294699 [Suillus bovinus]KAG2141423.1 hypothetical protein EDB93DRAFT_1294699 [Suillus bovinus]
MRILVFFCIFLYLAGAIQAAPTTNTTTITNDSVQAPSFTTRTLSTIIFSSVLTLFACIYSAIHPNIPSPKESSYLHFIWRQLCMTIMALIVPELIVTWAMRQWFSAHQVTRQFESLGYPKLIICPDSEEMDFVEEPATGNCFIRFLLCLPFIRLSILLTKGALSVPVFLWRFLCAPMRWVASCFGSEQLESDSEDYTWTQTHSFFVLMGGFMLYVDGEPYLTLRPDYILKLIHDKCIDIPILTANQIRDRSKGNAISKGLIMLQVAWFVLQLITRAIYHLETTQLEVGTLAFAVLSFLSYAMWWDKPLNVRCPHPVYWKSTESRPEDHINDTDEFAPLPIARSIFELIGFPRIPTSQRLQVPTFDGSITLERPDRKVLRLAAMIMATIFGGVHCMAWSFAFPTHQEQMLWRISAIATTCTPWLCWIIYLDSEVTHSIFRCIPDLLKYVVWGAYYLTYFACFALYVLARAVLLALMFTTLHNLPADAYKAVSWTGLVPHL